MGYGNPRGVFAKRVRKMFEVTKADWKAMSSSMKQTYANQYKFVYAKFHRDLIQLGFMKRYITCVHSMEDMGYTFDPLVSTNNRLCFYYDGGETYFGNWFHVIKFIDAYGKKVKK
jgi:hypothetical protein